MVVVVVVVKAAAKKKKVSWGGRNHIAGTVYLPTNEL
jgi:hypothetical protein